MNNTVTETYGSIDETNIQKMVSRFCDQVRQDSLLGPIFAQRVVSWEVHQVRLCAFWSSVMLETSRYEGNSLAPHCGLHLEPLHFERWLVLFGIAADSVFSPLQARALKLQAQSIFSDLKQTVFFQTQKEPSTVVEKGQVYGAEEVGYDS